MSNIDISQCAPLKCATYIKKSLSTNGCSDTYL